VQTELEINENRFFINSKPKPPDNLVWGWYNFITL